MDADRSADVVEFFCPECEHRWTREYEVVHGQLPSGYLYEFFRLNRLPVMSPYFQEGGLPCAQCGNRVTGTLLQRRLWQRHEEESG
ncbi:hypothetical protein LKL35_07330 [Streptomyces sp. ET3-23]|uniref:hypothetical protein n=1 Tax=Streptomyces sp. ET3-23 TaxID=2885643 RepID=UPI001D114674|nr:hypothetical protein [Streptomyces sp. ET3-23]MCC2275236.1 hypothetical protein [Streptomyces sp. ET3-23]